MLKKNDRVRLYSYELGNFYGTIRQDQSIAGGQTVLVHIDGLRWEAVRWINKDLVWAEAYPGEYSRERVSECTSPK